MHGIERPEPFQFPSAPGDQDDRAMEALDEPGRDDPDHAFVPVLVGEDVAAAALFRLRPLVDLLERLADDPVLDSLPLAVQLLELVRELAGLVLVLGQQQLERRARAAEPARRVDPRREPEADGALVDSGRVDTRNLHQRPEPRLLRARERRRPASASARFSSTSGTTSAIVARATRSRCRVSASWPAPSSASPSL